MPQLPNTLPAPVPPKVPVAGDLVDLWLRRNIITDVKAVFEAGERGGFQGAVREMGRSNPFTALNEGVNTVMQSAPKPPRW